MTEILEKLTKCEAIIGYEFTDKIRGASALHTFSSFSEKLDAVLPKNDTVAVLGNIVLQHYLCKK
jgi:hypothetical protein